MAQNLHPSVSRRTSSLHHFGRVLVVLGFLLALVGGIAPARAVQDPSVSGDDWHGEWNGTTWPPNASWTSQFLPTTNPSLAQGCGLDIGIVIDRSGSIADANKATAYRNAAKGLVDAFAGTPSKIGVWSFANKASDTDPAAYPWTQMHDVGGVNGPANVTALKATVDSIPIVTNFATNWEEGIRAADAGLHVGQPPARSAHRAHRWPAHGARRRRGERWHDEPRRPRRRHQVGQRDQGMGHPDLCRRSRWRDRQGTPADLRHDALQRRQRGHRRLPHVLLRQLRLGPPQLRHRPVRRLGDRHQAGLHARSARHLRTGRGLGLHRDRRGPAPGERHRQSGATASPAPTAR